jgi:hypothetical protein
MRGAFLDFQMTFSGAKLVNFGPPKLPSSFEALKVFAERDLAARAFLPINLSLLSERRVSTALRAPPIRRGRHPTTKRGSALTGAVALLTTLGGLKLGRS